MAERRKKAKGKESASGDSPQTPPLSEEEEEHEYGTPEQATTAFARRNPLLAAFIPDVLEDPVDALLPDAFEAKMERGAQRVARRCSRLKASFDLGVGELAGTLLRVCKYALSALDVHDIIFGIYSLAQHHMETRAEDAVRGTPVRNPVMLTWLLYCCNLAMAAYCPTEQEFAAAANCKAEDIVELQADSDSTRPAYAIGVDHKARQVVLAFRGTTDLNDMLTDACAVCTPYLDGYAHFGMLKAARWFVKHKLGMLRELCDEHPGYGLLLVGHSLGAGTATLVAHLIRKGDPEAAELMKGIKLHAVGIATPAVLTANLADGCNSYISSVVLQHDIVPRFSVYNVFAMKEEMDATGWQEKLKSTAEDWMVPDIIEHSETYKRLVRHSHSVLAVVTRALARWYLVLVQWVVTFLHWTGLLRLEGDSNGPTTAASSASGSGTAEPEAVHRTARQVVQDTVRGGLRATARAAQMHHRGLPDETLAAIERACEQATQGDACIHALYAPGRLYFLKRTDASKEEAEAIRKAVLERRASLKAEEAASANGGATEGAGKGSAAPAVEAVAAAAADASSSGGSSDDEDELLYPGAKFELIRGAPEERFRRIVLQDTCLKDHLCSCYCWAVQQLMAGQEAQGQGQEAQVKEGSQGEQSKRKEE